MIHLNGKDSFVIYHDKKSKTNQLIIGKWTLLKTKIHKPSFVFNLFNNQSYIINGESATINENVIIKNPTNFNILQDGMVFALQPLNTSIGSLGGQLFYIGNLGSFNRYSVLKIELIIQEILLRDGDHTCI